MLKRWDTLNSHWTSDEPIDSKMRFEALDQKVRLKDINFGGLLPNLWSSQLQSPNSYIAMAIGRIKVHARQSQLRRWLLSLLVASLVLLSCLAPWQTMVGPSSNQPFFLVDAFHDCVQSRKRARGRRSHRKHRQQQHNRPPIVLTNTLSISFVGLYIWCMCIIHMKCCF